MNFRKSIFTLLLLLTATLSKAQSFKFAFVTDTHVGSGTGADDLRRTVKDINADSTLRFVVLTGDITEFGADHELALAKQILDSLNKKWYIIPGNHDANWSESGSNSFRKVFGGETFAFSYGGYLFAGTTSGPNMRMGPGQIPRENIVWLDSLMKTTEVARTPVIYLNHYPQDSSLNNWYSAIDILKKTNVQLALCGHGHNNHKYNWEGIPAIMGRSNLRAKDTIGGYNIVTIGNGTATFEVKRPDGRLMPSWAQVVLTDHHFDHETKNWPRPSFAVNDKFSSVHKDWEYQDKSDIGAGTAAKQGLLVATNTSGDIYALDVKSGKVKWKFHTNGKIYSTPAISGNYVVAGSSDDNIYCLSLKTGALAWKAAAQKAVVASPAISGKTVYIGASDGHFRALDLKSGEVKWDFDKVAGFVVTRPLIYQGKVYFGCWGNDFYALDAKTGSLVWKWNNGQSNRMYSPAACYPVAAHNRIFIVAPDRYMTALDARDGKVIWREQKKDMRVRESMGLSADKSLVYVKTMDGEVYGISTKASTMTADWKAKLQLPYELAPTAIVEHKGIVYVPTHSGLTCAVSRKSGDVIWKYKTSNCLVAGITPVSKSTVVVNTMDGNISCLNYSGK